jgi:hypothetical protein
MNCQLIKENEMSSKNPEGKSGEFANLILREGEKIEFPVKPGEKFAEFQEMVEIESIEDIADFEFVKIWRRQVSGERDKSDSTNDSPKVHELFTKNLPSERMLVEYARQRGQLLRLRLSDFIVPAGATVTLNNPLNTIVADTVVITGDLLSYGDLAITCRELRG